jgi:hypothetical protein
MNAAHEATIAIYVEGSVTIDDQTFDASLSGVLALRFDDAGAVGAARLIDLTPTERSPSADCKPRAARSSAAPAPTARPASSPVDRRTARSRARLG